MRPSGPLAPLPLAGAWAGRRKHSPCPGGAAPGPAPGRLGWLRRAQPAGHAPPAFFPLLWTLDHCGRQEGKDRSAGQLTPHRDQAGQPPWGPTVVLPASSPGPARPLQQPPHLLTFSLTPVYTGLPHLPSSSPGEVAVNMFGFAVLLGTKAGGHH